MRFDFFTLQCRSRYYCVVPCGKYASAVQQLDSLSLAPYARGGVRLNDSKEPIRRSSPGGQGLELFHSLRMNGGQMRFPGFEFFETGALLFQALLVPGEKFELLLLAETVFLETIKAVHGLLDKTFGLGFVTLQDFRKSQVGLMQSTEALTAAETPDVEGDVADELRFEAGGWLVVAHLRFQECREIGGVLAVTEDWQPNGTVMRRAFEVGLICRRHDG